MHLIRPGKNPIEMTKWRIFSNGSSLTGIWKKNGYAVNTAPADGRAP
jgi:hypothetical protein